MKPVTAIDIYLRMVAGLEERVAELEAQVAKGEALAIAGRNIKHDNTLDPLNGDYKCGDCGDSFYEVNGDCILHEFAAALAAWEQDK